MIYVQSIETRAEGLNWSHRALYAISAANLRIMRVAGFRGETFRMLLNPTIGFK
ncbi:MAG TPA: hypothetical protein VH351_12410 [Bryobacteraceae bacterium]|nr:hypothetical protein [Bryobacteraceae bacterium]